MRRADTELLEPYQPLYLKYRPQSLVDLVGQSAVTQTLTNAIEHDRICHAYLFTGPRGCGKTSSARILAKSLNCDKGPTAKPCLECTSCIEIKQSISPNVFEIDAASNNSVDDARLLIERAPLAAQSGKHKLYIIDECHMLTKEAFNALLKTIEEPPAKVVFILATTEEHKVPPTIVSRCQRLMFRLVNQPELVAHLRKIADDEKIEIEDSALELIARRSGGGLRDALGLLDQASLLSQPGNPVGVPALLTLLGAVHEDVLIKISAGVLEKNGKDVLESAHTLMMEGREPALLALELAKHFLNLAKANYLLAGNTAEKDAQALILGSPGYLQALLAQAPKFDRVELAQMVEQLDKLEQSCRRSSQPALNLEIGLVSLCHRNEIRSLKQLEERVAQLEAELFPTAGGTRAAAPSARKEPPRNSIAAPAAASAGATTSAPPSIKTTTAATPSVSAASEPAPARTATIAASTDSSEHSSLTPQTMAPITPANEPPSSQPAAALAMTAASAASSSPLQTAQPLTAASEPSPAKTSTATAPSISAVEQSSSQEEEEAVPASISIIAEEEEQPSAPLNTATVNTAAPAASPEATTQSTEPAASPEYERQFASQIELEELWSNVVDELQRRHLPTYSLVNSQGFPVAFENDSLTVGVRADHLQKMLENKSEHIKGACAAVLGRPIHVRIKVVGQATPKAPAPRGKKAPVPEDAQVEGDRARAPEAPSPSQPATSPPTQSQPQSQPTPAPLATASEAARSESESDATLLHEAYKLFDGPGSRRITPT